MERRRTLQTTSRSSIVALDPGAAWDVVASGVDTRQWYADAAPFVFRGALDRLVRGPGRRVRPPGRTRLRTGDRVGFWKVLEADHDARRLLLEAQVRAPGTVTLEATVTAHMTGSVVSLTIALEPRGLLGRAYLLADLPARALVAELTMLDLLTALRRRVGPEDNRSGSTSVDQA